MPEIDENILNIRYALASGASLTAEQQAVWGKIKALVNHFKSFDKYVISLPMWNFSLPYKLKHYQAKALY